MFVHIPFGKPVDVQWHCAATRKELQKPGPSIADATGHEEIDAEKQEMEHKLTHKNTNDRNMSNVLIKPNHTSVRSLKNRGKHLR